MVWRTGRVGRQGRGFFNCPRCGRAVDHAEAVEVIRPGRTRGVWWCPVCVTDCGRFRNV